LLAMGEEEIATLLEKEGHVEVSCDFCNRHYIFDCIDIAALFSRSFRLAIPRLHWLGATFSGRLFVKANRQK
jgi:molecular chaperone Hsp33